MGEESRDVSGYVFPVVALGNAWGLYAPLLLGRALGCDESYFILVPMLGSSLFFYVLSEAAFAYIVGRFFPRWELTKRLNDNPKAGVFGPSNRAISRLFEFGRAQALGKP